MITGTRTVVPAILLLLLTTGGCATVIETASIARFTSALADADLEALRDNTSPYFEQKALRLDEAINDLKVLALPNEELSVISVEDVTDETKEVTVAVEGSSRQLRYRLIRDEQTGRWVVDDIDMNQQRPGLNVTKSVTEQMDLLLSVREFFAAWNSDSREDVLEATADELSGVLADLPPAYLAMLTRSVAGGISDGYTRQPDATMDDDVAVVQLHSRQGSILISMRRSDDGWKVQDAAVDTGDPETRIRSLLKRARAIRTAVGFLDAWAAGDRNKLSSFCSKRLLNNALQYADLSMVPLPDSIAARSEWKVRIHGDAADFVVAGPDGVVRLELVSDTSNGADEVDERFVVREVTLYEHGNHNSKRLSVVFTARARMLLFAEALGRRDPVMLQRYSTPDFNSRVWNRVDKEMLQMLPLPAVGTSPPRLLAEEFRGMLAELTVEQDGRELTYVLRDWNGEPLVDDVLGTGTSRLGSLRTRLEVAIPVVQFAAGIATNRIDAVQRHSSFNFKRLVWAQADTVPDLGFPIAELLQTPIKRIVRSDGKARLDLGDRKWGAQVDLVRERNQWVVDEILLIAGTEPSRQTKMKRAMRIQLAYGLNRRPPQAATGKQPITDGYPVRLSRNDGSPQNHRESPASDRTAGREDSRTLRPVSRRTRITDPSLSPIAIPD